MVTNDAKTIDLYMQEVIKVFTGVVVYFNAKSGFMFCSLTKDKQTKMPTLLSPASTCPANSDASTLSRMIIQAIDYSRKNPVADISDDYEFWTDVGYKSYKTFCKENAAVKIFVNDEHCTVRKLKMATKAGGYAIYHGFSFECQEDELFDNISKIQEFLTVPHTDEFSSQNEFTALSDRKVSYMDLSERFLDVGDANTDAYQVYIDNENDKNHIAFMVDSGYDSFSEDSIKRKFEQYYGEMDHFSFSFVTNKHYQIKIVAQTQLLSVVSYLFPDDDDVYLEVIYEIDRTQSPETIEAVQNEFEQVVDSVRITE